MFRHPFAVGVAAAILGASAQVTFASEPTVLKPHAVRDASAKVTAFHVWAPAHWRVQGGVGYNQVPSMAMAVSFVAQQPDGTLGVERVHGEPRSVWSMGPFGPSHREGDNYFGNPVERTKDAATFVKTNLLPVMRQQHRDYEIVEITHQPKWIEALNEAQKLSPMNALLLRSGGRVAFDAVIVRGKYTVKGQAMEDVLHLTMQYQIAQMSNMSATTWGIYTADRMFAPKGTLADHEPMLRTVARSMRLDGKWWTGMQATRIRVWGVQRDAQQDWDAYIRFQNELMRRRDRIYEGFDHYIRGTGIYKNPADGSLWELPSQQKYIWFGPHQEVLTTDNPNYNPNTDGKQGGAWTAAK